MTIAVLGWGSLIWKTNGLPIRGDWHQGGPDLPIEFSRVSRDGRLTLVIDHIAVVPVRTRYAISARSRIEDAIADLAAREETSLRYIGSVVAASGDCSPATTQDEKAVCARVLAWCKATGTDGAVWTALPSNFQERTSKPFSTENALEYLEALPAEAKSAALHYIKMAPEEVVTPVRTASGDIHGSRAQSKIE